MPRTFAYAVGGLLMLAASRRLLRDVAQPGELQEVLRGLPHNITTEMDLKLWELTEEIRNDEPPVRSSLNWQYLISAALPGARVAARCAARPSGILATLGIVRSPRSTSACRAGRMIRATYWGDQQLSAPRH